MVNHKWPANVSMWSIKKDSQGESYNTNLKWSMLQCHSVHSNLSCSVAGGSLATQSTTLPLQIFLQFATWQDRGCFLSVHWSHAKSQAEQLSQKTPKQKWIGFSWERSFPFIPVSSQFLTISCQLLPRIKVTKQNYQVLQVLQNSREEDQLFHTFIWLFSAPYV